MELREYCVVIRRHAGIVGLVVGLVLLASALILALVPSERSGGSDRATTTLLVRPIPEPRTGSYYAYDDFYAYQASDYVLDDLILLLESERFREALAEQISSETSIDVAGSVIEARKERRVLTITVTARTFEAARATAELCVASLTADGGVLRGYLDNAAARGADVTVLSPPAAQAPEAGLSAMRTVASVALRATPGLVAGLALAFLVDYLDGTFRDRADVERALGLRALGEIPADRRRASRGRA